jgi:hypothetical protein
MPLQPFFRSASTHTLSANVPEMTGPMQYDRSIYMNVNTDYPSPGDLSHEEIERLVERGRALRNEAISEGLASLFRGIKNAFGAASREDSVTTAHGGRSAHAT